MKNPLWLAAVGLCLTAPGWGRADPITITFDEAKIGGVVNPAASTFDQTPGPLTDFYHPMGVLFSGFGGGTGGAILSQDGGFGVPAHSGTNFLAFNRDWGSTDPEQITFVPQVTQASIFAAGGFIADTFEMDAYDSVGNLLSTDIVTTKGWQQLSVSGLPGDDIASVVLTETGPGVTWVYDDLSFTPDSNPGAVVLTTGGPANGAPEPTGALLLGVGGLGLVGWRWRPWRRK